MPISSAAYDDIPSLGYTDALYLMRVCRAANVPTLMWGGPGIGKSSLMEYVRNNIHTGEVITDPNERERAIEADIGKSPILEPMVTLIGSISDPTEIMGFPMPITNPDTGEQEVVFVPRDWVNRILNADRGVVFLDELTTCAPAVQNALLRLVLAKAAGDKILPAETFIAAAANPPNIILGGQDLTPPMANRFAHFQLDPKKTNDVNVGTNGVAPYLRGQNEGWPSLYKDVAVPVPHSSEKKAQIQAMVWSYLYAHPAAVNDSAENVKDSRLAYATQRSWDMVGRMFRYIDPLDSDPVRKGLAVNCISAVVGTHHAIGLMDHIKHIDMPTPDVVLECFGEKGRGFKDQRLSHIDPVNSRALIWAMTTAVVDYVGSNIPQHYDASQNYLGALADNSNKEIGMAMFNRFYNSTVMDALIKAGRPGNTLLNPKVLSAYGQESSMIEKQVKEALEEAKNR